MARKTLLSILADKFKEIYHAPTAVEIIGNALVNTKKSYLNRLDDVKKLVMVYSHSLIAASEEVNNLDSILNTTSDYLSQMPKRVKNYEEVQNKIGEIRDNLRNSKTYQPLDKTLAQDAFSPEYVKRQTTMVVQPIKAPSHDYKYASSEGARELAEQEKQYYDRISQERVKRNSPSIYNRIKKSFGFAYN